ncbi:putative protein-specific protease 1 [Orchesella cincta]|uniref:Ubiquitin-like protease family profile domain-containing protein n=1 Tax=Orchesella cincta TaxID=48709 RepID=A0A1D2NC31_ORCCI|nr:putative protein-specific protease 1 [Orchesella cincta]
MSHGKVVLDYGDSLIRESEVDILKTNQWLNDAVIGFHFEYLGNQAKSHNDPKLELYGPAVTQLLKLIPSSEELQCILGDGLETIEYAVWPVNDSTETEKGYSGSHWSLLVFSRPDNKFMHFDSYGGSNESAARMLYKKLSPLFSSTSTFHDFEGCCAQANGRDCGLHVIMNAELIVDFIHKSSLSSRPSLWKNGLSTATPKQAESKRKELLELIASLSKHRK